MTELSQNTELIIKSIHSLLNDIGEEIDKSSHLVRSGLMDEGEFYKALQQFEYELSDYRTYWHYPPEDEDNFSECEDDD